MNGNSLSTFSARRGINFSLPLFLLASAFIDLRAGTLYVAERYNGRVVAVDTLTGGTSLVASGLGAMIGAVVDRRGRLFVSRFDAGSVALVNPITGSFADIASGMVVHCLAASPNSDKLFVAGHDSKSVYQLTEQDSGEWSVEVILSGLGVPNGVYADIDTLYVGTFSQELLEYKLSSGALETLVRLPSGAQMISRDPSGHLIVGTILGPVCRVDPVARRLVRTYTGFANPAGVIVDPADNSVLVGEHNGQRITRLHLESNVRSILTRSVAVPYQNAFAKMVELPLSLETPVLNGDLLTLRWTGGPGVKLQQSHDLASPDWQEVPGSEGLSRIDLPMDRPHHFFRVLIQP